MGVFFPSVLTVITVGSVITMGSVYSSNDSPFRENDRETSVFVSRVMSLLEVVFSREASDEYTDTSSTGKYVAPSSIEFSTFFCLARRAEKKGSINSGISQNGTFSI